MVVEGKIDEAFSHGLGLPDGVKLGTFD